jgi:predicted kinase
MELTLRVGATLSGEQIFANEDVTGDGSLNVLDVAALLGET